MQTNQLRVHIPQTPSFSGSHSITPRHQISGLITPGLVFRHLRAAPTTQSLRKLFKLTNPKPVYLASLFPSSINCNSLLPLFSPYSFCFRLTLVLPHGAPAWNHICLPLGISSFLFFFCGEKCSSFFFFFLIIIYFEVRLIYNVVLVSGIQQNDHYTYMYLFFFRLFSFIGYYRILTVPSAIQQVLAGYLLFQTPNLF